VRRVGFIGPGQNGDANGIHIGVAELGVLTEHDNRRAVRSLRPKIKAKESRPRASDNLRPVQITAA
jgi:hypothetical protein